MAFAKILRYCAGPLALAGLAFAHGGAHQKPITVDADADWVTRHLAGIFTPSLRFGECKTNMYVQRSIIFPILTQAPSLLYTTTMITVSGMPKKYRLLMDSSMKLPRMCRRTRKMPLQLLL